MKIFFLSLMNGSYWGGSEEMWFRLARWMSEQGHEVGAGCYDWPEKKNKLEALTRAGAVIHLLPKGNNFFQKRKLKKALDKIPFETYDLVFVNQGGYKEVVYSPFHELYRRFKKYLLCFHNYDEKENLDAARRESLKCWMENASLNVGAASKIFQVIEDNFKISVQQKETWANPVTIPVPQNSTPYPGLINGNYIWCMLAELDMYRKSQDLLINTLSSEKWKQRNWLLHLYGRGKDAALLEQLIAKKQLSEKIILKGFTNDVALVITNSHLLLQCTRIDAMPLSMVEAMALSRPCMVSKAGDMPYWIENGISGFVVDELTVKGLDEKLEECWQQKDHWEELGRKAFAVFKEKYPSPYESSIVSRLASL